MKIENLFLSLIECKKQRKVCLRFRHTIFKNRGFRSGTKYEFATHTLFNRYQGRYGAPRIHRELIQQYDCDGSLARVKRLMRQAGLRAKSQRKFKATTDSNHAHPIAKNLLDQQFQPAGPNQVWLSEGLA